MALSGRISVLTQNPGIISEFDSDSAAERALRICYCSLVIVIRMIEQEKKKQKIKVAQTFITCPHCSLETRALFAINTHLAPFEVKEILDKISFKEFFAQTMRCFLQSPQNRYIQKLSLPAMGSVNSNDFNSLGMRLQLPQNHTYAHI